jgi:hypothetical protein
LFGHKFAAQIHKILDFSILDIPLPTILTDVWLKIY